MQFRSTLNAVTRVATTNLSTIAIRIRSANPFCVSGATLPLAGVMVFSTVLAVFIIGPSRIDPWNLGWQIDDYFTLQLAFEAYRRDPISAFALTSERLMEPLPINLSFYDPIPLLILPLKLLTRKAAEYQFIGAYLVVCSILQGLFAFLALREISQLRRDRQTIFACALGAVILAMSPMLIARWQFHLAISSHWLLLAAFWLLFRAGRVGAKNTAGAYSILFFVAGGINPYMTLMVFFIYAGCCLKFVWDEKRVEPMLLIPPIVGVASLMTFGFFSFRSGGMMTAFGYGSFNANLLAFFNPLFHTTTFMPILPKASVYQGDAFGYLGVGWMLLIAIGAVLALRHRREFSASSVVAIAAIVVSSFAFATQGVVTLGEWVLFSSELPKGLLKIVESFRAAGRFVWVAGYALVFASLVVAFKCLPARRLISLFVIIAAIQAVDLAPWALHIRNYLATRVAQRLQSPDWKAAGEGYKRIVVVPPWQCGVREQQPTPGNYMLLGRLALDYNLALSSTNAARTPVDQWAQCGRLLTDVPRNPPALDAIYVFSIGSFKKWGGTVEAEYYCELADGMVFCRKGEHGGRGPLLSEALATP